MEVGLSLMKIVLTPSAKSVLIPLGLTAAASATDTAFQKKLWRSGITTLIILNKEMKDMKIVKNLEELDLLIRGASKTIENEEKKQKKGFLGMLIGTSGASILGSVLAGKAKIPGRGVIRTVEGIIRADQD